MLKPLNPTAHPYGFLSLLTAFVILGNSATDMYLPALPTIAYYFQAPSSLAQATLTSYMIGFSVCMLLSGSLSDRFGRRPVAIAFLGLQVMASLMCALSFSIHLLIIARFLQGLGGAFGTVLARLIVNDVFHERNAVRAMAFISTAMMLSPLLAPVFGGVLLYYLNWQFIFIVLTALGLLILLSSWLWLPETNTHIDRDVLQVKIIKNQLLYLSGQRTYLGHSLLIIFSWMGCFAFISGSPYFYIHLHHLTPIAYAAVYTVQIMGYMIGALIARFVAKQFDIDRYFHWNILYIVIVGLAGSVINLIYPNNMVLFVVLVTAFLCGVGFMMPNSQAGAFRYLKQTRGIGASLLFSIEMLGAALASYWVGHDHQSGNQLMVLLIFISTLLMLLTFIGFFSRGKIKNGHLANSSKDEER